jgi:hypothetical protein
VPDSAAAPICNLQELNQEELNLQEISAQKATVQGMNVHKQPFRR